MQVGGGSDRCAEPSSRADPIHLLYFLPDTKINYQEEREDERKDLTDRSRIDF